MAQPGEKGLRSILPALAECLPHGYLPLPGSLLSATDFHPDNDGWCVQLRDGSSCLIAPISPELNPNTLAECYIGAVKQLFCDPYTRLVNGHRATVAQWFEALSRADLLAPILLPHSWCTVNYQAFERSTQMRTVVFDDEHQALANFLQAATLQAWLQDLLNPLNINVDIYGITNPDRQLQSRGHISSHWEKSGIKTSSNTFPFSMLKTTYQLTADKELIDTLDWWLLSIAGSEHCLPLDKKHCNIEVEISPNALFIKTLRTEQATQNIFMKDQQRRRYSRV